MVLQNFGNSSRGGGPGRCFGVDDRQHFWLECTELFLDDGGVKSCPQAPDGFADWRRNFRPRQPSFPNTPAAHTRTRSPGSTTLTKAASIPAVPVQRSKSLGIWWQRHTQQVLILSMILRNSGSRCHQGLAMAKRTRGSALDGPGPIKMRAGG